MQNSIFIEGPLSGFPVVLDPFLHRIVGRDFPSPESPVSPTVCVAAIAWYDKGIFEAETLLQNARAAFRFETIRNLEAYHRRLTFERGVWRDAQFRSAAQPRPRDLNASSLWNRSQGGEQAQ